MAFYLKMTIDLAQSWTAQNIEIFSFKSYYMVSCCVEQAHHLFITRNHLLSYAWLALYNERLSDPRENSTKRKFKCQDESPLVASVVTDRLLGENQLGRTGIFE